MHASGDPAALLVLEQATPAEAAHYRQALGLDRPLYQQYVQCMSQFWCSHTIRSFIPVITVMGLQCGALVQGAIVVEPIFAWPGLGWLLVEAIAARDFPVVVAGAMIAAVFVTLVNLSVDLLYGWLDPRIRVH